VNQVKKMKLLALAALLTLAVGTAGSATHDIYPDPAQAKVDLAAALKTAAATHKRILLDFGGNWCGDCQVLDIYMHDPSNRPILDANFVLVHVNIGHKDENLDLARKYQVPVADGVPAMAVLSEKGALLNSQRNGQFKSMRTMSSSAVTSFLVQWKPTRPGCSAVMITC
jgi:thiol:disulfide interchange protein